MSSEPPAPSGTGPPCVGLNNEAATNIVGIGRPTVLVRATIQAPPTQESGAANLHWYKPEHVSVLAGRLRNGPLARINEAEGDITDFAPGDYLFLLGPLQTPGDYYVAAGILGAFRVAGSGADQLCPNPPGPPVPTPGPIRQLDDIAGLFSPLLSTTGG